MGSAKFQRYSQALDLSLEYLKGSSAETELVAILSNSLGDDDANVRYRAAQSLGQLGQATPEVVQVLLDGAHLAPSWSTRRDYINLVGKIGKYDQQTVDVLLMGFTDQDNGVRAACAQALARLGQRNPEAVEEIASTLIQTLEDPRFGPVDPYAKRTGYDYAFDALWMLIVSE